MAVNFGPSPVTVPVGTTMFGPVTVPSGVSTVTVAVACNWTPAARTLAAGFEFSGDGGNTWQMFGGFNPTPGSNTFVDRSGVAAYSVVIGPMPPVDGFPRQLRVNLTAAGGPITTTLTVSTA